MSTTGLGMSPDPGSIQRQQLQMVGKSAASWFLWIAGLSMLNSVISSFDGNWHFLFGLGITSIVDAVSHQAGTTGIVLDLVINGFIAGIFLLFWYFAGQGQKWAFYVGMGLYLFDGLILLLFHDYLGAAFHIWVLYRLYQGLSLVSRVQAAHASMAAASGAPILPQ
jgi:hypothetical protein